jgi:hypothetical protein
MIINIRTRLSSLLGSFASENISGIVAKETRARAEEDVYREWFGENIPDYTRQSWFQRNENLIFRRYVAKGPC